MSSVGEALRETAIINLTGAVTMVVDDSPFSAEITTSALLGFGIRTKYSCRSAPDAMAILAEAEIDLLVVDCEMPGMEVGEYFGPDRRFREGTPPGKERRSDILRRVDFEAQKAAQAAEAAAGAAQ